MFSSIAPRYDVTNVVLSLGVDRLWRRVAVRESGATSEPASSTAPPAPGTWRSRCAERWAPAARVVGMDFCAAMLGPAREKARRAGLEDIRFEEGDALALRYPAGAFDVATIAFGIRNVDDPVRCLKEMARVVRPGGRVVVLEFGQPEGPVGSCCTGSTHAPSCPRWGDCSPATGRRTPTCPAPRRPFPRRALPGAHGRSRRFLCAPRGVPERRHCLRLRGRSPLSRTGVRSGR